MVGRRGEERKRGIIYNSAFLLKTYKWLVVLLM
jgi:hypothetical protein